MKREGDKDVLVLEELNEDLKKIYFPISENITGDDYLLIPNLLIDTITSHIQELKEIELGIRNEYITRVLENLVIAENKINKYIQ